MMRNTVQRQIILDTLKSLKTHPTAEDLHKEIQKKYPSIGMATVYRNLRQMTESGIIAQIATTDDAARYDGNAEQHYHFHCAACGMTFDLEIEMISDEFEAAIEEKYDIRIDKHDISFIGTCSTCISR